MMKPKIALINGSPRKENSFEITKYIETKYSKEADFETFNLGDMKLNYCVDCKWCNNNEGVCVQDDDINKMYSDVVKYNGVIMISPVYFGGVTAQLKTVLDRTKPLRKIWSLKDKVGAAITVGASRNGGQELVIQDIHAAMHINGMIIVGDDSHFGGTCINPFNTDEYGKKTVDRTIEKVIRITKKLIQ